jgi:RNA polymerase sigma-70 factor (ECF subfamily)
LKEQFQNMIATHQGLIFKVCHMYCDNPEDKEDLFQDVLLQLWRAYPGFKGQSKVSTWLYQVALNTALAGLRKRKRAHQFDQLNDAAFEVPVENSPADEKRADMYAAIKLLTDIERAVTMLYMDEFSYREIGEILGLTESNVGVKLNKVKTKLKAILKQA